jgi:DNA-binding transcriptional LysR family regulator
MEWDDLRVFVELARAGTLTRAAARLDVRHTTIARRIRRLEQRIGAPLFLRERDGFKLSRRGAELWLEAARIDEAFARIAQDLPERAGDVSGLVRIGCTEGFGTAVVAPMMGRLRARHPGLQIDLIVQPRPILLTRNEADLVVTIDRPERGDYVISRLTEYSLRLYAAPAYLAARAPLAALDDLAGHALISYVDEQSPWRNVPTMSDIRMSAATVLRSTSILAQKAMARAGAGIAILPDFLVEPGDGLVPVLGESVVFQREFWTVMPQGLREVARVRRVAEALHEMMRAERERLAPSGGASQKTTRR